MLNEALIKSAVIDRLFESGVLDDAVLVNEMVVANWSRRADLAVANGKLHAFEIKSDLDTLRRLEAQVDTYLSRFDKVTVVTTHRYLSAVKAMLPTEVEIWEVTLNQGTTSIRIARRGRTIEIKNKRLLCGFLHKPEMVKLLRSHGIKESSDSPREVLIETIESLSVGKVREFVISSIKARYKATFELFSQSRDGATHAGDLGKLSKLTLLMNKDLGEKNHHNATAPSRLERKIDISSLERKFGPLPENTPQTVLLRVPKSVRNTS